MSRPPRVKRGARVTPERGAEWVAYAARRPVRDVVAVLSDEQLAVLGSWLSRNKLLNPPRGSRLRVGEFRCKCGCGEVFRAEYRTKHPQFKNEAHRMRYWRARSRVEAG
jgi:hypothetical protein